MGTSEQRGLSRQTEQGSVPARDRFPLDGQGQRLGRRIGADDAAAGIDETDRARKGREHSGSVKNCVLGAARG